MSGRIPALEAARGVAALMVVAAHTHSFHLQDHVPPARWLGFTAQGWLGVQVFFVLSGLVLYLPYARGKHFRLGDYITARVLRIVPAFWVALALSATILGLWSSDTIRSGVFLNAQTHPATDAISPAWSLTIEVGFYVLLPLLVWIFARVPISRTPILVGFLAIGIFARNGVYFGAPMTPLAYVDNFAMGMLAAIFVANVRLPCWMLSIGAGAFALGIAWVAVDRWAIEIAVTGVLFAVALATIAAVNPTVPTPFVWLGTISYGIYLWHWPVLRVATTHGLYRLPDALEPVIVAAFSILLGWASWRLIEKPALALRGGSITQQAHRPSFATPP